MNKALENIYSLKGFMPQHEGTALMKWCSEFCTSNPVLEIGSFCGKSAHLIAYALQGSKQKVFTIDHHLGSEEHQADQEYFDPEIYDENLKLVNTLPIFIKNLGSQNLSSKIIPLIGKSKDIAKAWNGKLGLLFIDGGHAFETALQDYNSWKEHIAEDGVLVFHDIYEDPDLGGLAPYKVMQESLNEGFKVIDREDTMVCLQKIVSP